MAQMQTQLSNTNKNGGNDNITSGVNKSKKVPFFIYGNYPFSVTT